MDLRLDIRLGKNLDARREHITVLTRETKAGSAADERRTLNLQLFRELSRPEQGSRS
jgi:hypothetical protein